MKMHEQLYVRWMARFEIRKKREWLENFASGKPTGIEICAPSSSVDTQYVGYLKYSLFHKFVARLTELYRVVFAVSNE
jgi:hypothetical protein